MTPRLPLVIMLGVAVLALAPSAQAQQPAVRAESGGVAIGGSVRDSTITVGIPPQQLNALIQQHADYSETQKKLIAELETKLDLNQRQIRAALDILGEKDIPPERLASTLVEIADRFKTLQATALAKPGDDAKIATLKAGAQKAIEAGDLARADSLLTEVRTEQRRMRNRYALDEAETSARLGDIALTRLRYVEAAQHFATAAGALPAEGAHQDKQIDYLRKEADALYHQGDEFGHNDALVMTIARNRSLLNLALRERVPLDWARTQNNLGNALSALGERESDTARLNEAVAAYREALKEYTRERVPLQWATTQNNLDLALKLLKERTPKPKRTAR
jgi:tetratricopeptide (TPR) repeat protein